jgi:integrase
LKGHVRKRGKKWCIVVDTGVDPKGKRKQRWFSGYATKKEAEADLANVLHQINTGEYREPAKITLLDHLKTWLKSKEPGLARQTVVAYRNIIANRIANDAIGSALVSGLKPGHLEDYYARLRQAGFKEYTVLHHHRLLHQSLKRAVRDQLLVKNPTEDVDLEKIRRYKATTYNAAMVVKMLECLHDEDVYAPILLAIGGGLRRGEDLGAHWQDLDLENGILNVNQAYYVVDGVAGFDPVKSDNSEDVVYLPGFVVDELKHIRKQQKKRKLQLGAAYQDHDLICCRADGSPWNPSTISKRFSVALARHGLPHIRFHDLRHSHATILHEYGADMKDISDRLRHATVQITSDTYTDMTSKKRRQVADVFNRAIMGQKKSPLRQRGEA